MEHIKKIAVYDFDKTLAFTPENTPENRTMWEQFHGRKWPHKGSGWWSKEESMDLSVFDVKLNKIVQDSAMKAIEDLETHAVLLTGRIPKFSKHIKEICRRNGMSYFNDYFFNDSSNTLSFKLSKLDHLKNTFTFAKHFEMWEDRVEHIPHFQEWGEKNYGNNFKLYIIE